MSEPRAAEAGETAVEIPSRYRVHRLPDPKPTERGIVYRRGDQRLLLEWTRVRRALAAQVGEPADASRVVFDLAVEIRGSVCRVCRVDAAPGGAALALACSILLGVGRERCGEALREIATEGESARVYPEIEAFEEANLEALRFVR